MKRYLLLGLLAVGLGALANLLWQSSPELPVAVEETTFVSTWPRVAAAQPDPDADRKRRWSAAETERVRLRRLSEPAALELVRRLNEASRDFNVSFDDQRTYASQWELLSNDAWHIEGEAAHALKEVTAFAVERPDMFGKLVTIIGPSPDPEFARLVSSLMKMGEEAGHCAVLARELAVLGLPSVWGRRREAIARGGSRGMPESPWLERRVEGTEVTGVWNFGGQELGDCLLFDDGGFRSASQGIGWINFRDEVKRFLATTEDSMATEALLRQTALFALWAMQRGDYEEGLACYRRVRLIGRKSWPEEGDAELGRRAAKSERPLQTAGSKATERALSKLRRWGRVPEAGLALLPAEPPRWHRAAPPLHRTRIRTGLRYADVSWKELETLPRRQQAEAAFFRLYAWTSPHLRRGSIAGFVSDLEDCAYLPDNPAAFLYSLGWDAVPVLIDHLDDPALTPIECGERTLRVGDLSWLILRAITGFPDPPDFSPEEPWIVPSDNLGVFCDSIDAWWAKVGDLPEADRWMSLFERGSARATDWLLRHAPERCFKAAWDRTDPSSRAGQLQRKELERSLSFAPREKLEALIGATEGDAQEAVKRVLADNRR